MLATTFAGLSSVSLAQILEQAELQTRMDRKYIVSTDRAAHSIAELAQRLCVLEMDGARDFGYESVYFDTPDLQSYRGSAYGRRQRFKVRTRSYLDSGLCVLEVKTVGGRGHTIKDRVGYRLDGRSTLDDFAREFLYQQGLSEAVVLSLAPVLATTYRRSTLVDESGARMTIDVGLDCRSMRPGVELQAGIGDRVIVETKSTGTATELDRLLWSVGERPVSVSKYGTGMAAITPDLPANKWHRTLNRYFTGPRTRASLGLAITA